MDADHKEPWSAMFWRHRYLQSRVKRTARWSGTWARYVQLEYSDLRPSQATLLIRNKKLSAVSEKLVLKKLSSPEKINTHTHTACAKELQMAAADLCISSIRGIYLGPSGCQSVFLPKSTHHNLTPDKRFFEILIILIGVCMCACAFMCVCVCVCLRACVRARMMPNLWGILHLFVKIIMERKLKENKNWKTKNGQENSKKATHHTRMQKSQRRP